MGANAHGQLAELARIEPLSLTHQLLFDLDAGREWDIIG